MRRLLVVVVLLATMSAKWIAAASARVVPPSDGHGTRVQKVVAFAQHQLGIPYRWGGTSRQTGFDCSGLVYAAYRSVGMKIPRSTWGQLDVGRRVGFGRLRPGDLVFTNGGGHVQLVVSKSAAISAPQTGERVRYVPLRQLRPEFAGARRLLK
jgi:cell wall-associated NlpC family hydrolase